MFQSGETTVEGLRSKPWFRAMRFQSCAVNDCGSNSIGAVFYAEDEDDTDGEPVCLCQKHFSQVLAAESPVPIISGPLFSTAAAQASAQAL